MPLTVVVLGGYGLIGAALMRRLAKAGHNVIGVGRSERAAQRVFPDVEWRFADLAQMTPRLWQQVLKGADVVVNAAGALQDGGQDNLTAIHRDMIAGLTAALAGTSTTVVQISAMGAGVTASTAFLRSKAEGDLLLAQSGLAHVILRPALVLGPQAYGGTAVLRAAAALPMLHLRIFPTAPIQTVALADLEAAVLQAVEGQIPSGLIADLSEPTSHSFDVLVLETRRWLGLPAPRLILTPPRVMLTLLGKTADALASLGWRSPLRSTALTTLSEGITGDPSRWGAAGGQTCRPLAQTLRDMPATVQERWFARSYLMLPLVVLTLSLFWLLSGLIGLANFDAATTVLTSRGQAGGMAQVAVSLGILLDLSLGGLVLFRRWMKPACLGMIATTLGYLVMGSLLAPDLWTDPMGPFVKALPAAVLAALPLAWGENR